MDYETYVDFGAGGEHEVTVDVDYDWMVDAVEDAVIEAYIDQLDDDDVLELVDTKLSLKLVLQHYAKIDADALAATAVEVLESLKE